MVPRSKAEHWSPSAHPQDVYWDRPLHLGSREPVRSAVPSIQSSLLFVCLFSTDEPRDIPGSGFDIRVQGFFLHCIALFGVIAHTEGWWVQRRYS